MINGHECGRGRWVDFSELDHNGWSDCQNIYDITVGLMCYRCEVRHICHHGGNVNHKQLSACMLAVLHIETEKRPKNVRDLIYREDVE
jgi:hypothetical protein